MTATRAQVLEGLKAARNGAAYLLRDGKHAALVPHEIVDDAIAYLEWLRARLAPPLTEEEQRWAAAAIDRYQGGGYGPDSRTYCRPCRQWCSPISHTTPSPYQRARMDARPDLGPPAVNREEV